MTLSASLLNVRIALTLGAMPLDVSFGSDAPWTVLFGPSGSGKTTVMRAIAGLVKPRTGRISLRGDDLLNSTAKISIAPHLRPVRAAMQGGLLFPHRTVLQNVLYGRGRGAGSAEAVDIAELILDAFGISSLLQKLPREISGGEARRVSVARAILAAVTFDGPSPPLLLLDEPLTGLDLLARDRMIAELKKWTEERQIPVLSVTHDVSEAFQLGAHVVKLDGGRVVEEGTAHVVLASERDNILRQFGQLS